MNIENMTDEQKSVMLAKLRGWWITADDYLVMDDEIAKMRGGWAMGMGNPVKMPNLYEPQNMALAWGFMNWANNEWESGEDWLDGLWTWFSEVEWFKHQPLDAIRLWLDKILSLAIEAGMVGGTS